MVDGRLRGNRSAQIHASHQTLSDHIRCRVSFIRLKRAGRIGRQICTHSLSFPSTTYRGIAIAFPPGSNELRNTSNQSNRGTPRLFHARRPQTCTPSPRRSRGSRARCLFFAYINLSGQMENSTISPLSFRLIRSDLNNSFSSIDFGSESPAPLRTR